MGIRLSSRLGVMGLIVMLVFRFTLLVLRSRGSLYWVRVNLVRLRILLVGCLIFVFMVVVLLIILIRIVRCRVLRLGLIMRI